MNPCPYLWHQAPVVLHELRQAGAVRLRIEVREAVRCTVGGPGAGGEGLPEVLQARVERDCHPPCRIVWGKCETIMCNYFCGTGARGGHTCNPRGERSLAVAITSPVVLRSKPEPKVPTTTHTPSGFVPHLEGGG